MIDGRTKRKRGQTRRIPDPLESLNTLQQTPVLYLLMSHPSPLPRHLASMHPRTIPPPTANIPTIPPLIHLRMIDKLHPIATEPLLKPIANIHTPIQLPLQPILPPLYGHPPPISLRVVIFAAVVVRVFEDVVGWGVERVCWVWAGLGFECEELEGG